MPSPSEPPRPAPVAAPVHPFDKWLMEQAIAGHDRQWLQRNRPNLLRRWKRDDSPLPPPPPTEPRPVPDRYSEA
jgi:hypothetical protein